MNEKQLYNLKWYDYRPYMPDTATLIFIGEWVNAFDRLLVKMGFDHFENNRGEVVKKDYPYSSGNIVYLKAVNDGEDWKRFTTLRKDCDVRTVPYWVFWEVALQTMVNYDGFDFGLQAFDNLLLLGSAFEHVKNLLKDGQIVFARMPFLQPDRYTGTQIQKDYCEYIVFKVNERYG